MPYSECQSGKLVDAICHDKWHNGRMVKEDRTGQRCFAATRRLSEMLRIHAIADAAWFG